MKETLENVEQNVSGEAPQETPSESTEEVPADGESIIEDLDESILGEDVIAGSTEDPSLAEGTTDSYDEDMNSEEDEWDYEEGTDDTEEPVTEYVDEGDMPEEIPDDMDTYEDDGMDTIDVDSLSEDARALYDKAEKFCAGEYKGDAAALQEVVDGAVPTVMLDAETADKLTERVMKTFLEILDDGAASYVPADTDLYLTPELNMLNNEMMKIFGLTVDDSGMEDILAYVSVEDKQTLYDDTMIFFEGLYGESVKSYEELMGGTEESYAEEGYTEEGYTEEGYTEEDYSEESYAE